MKISRSKKKLDPHTQQSGISETDYHAYNIHFWRFEANIFHGDMVRLNHILKDLARCREDHDILDMICALIYSKNEWTIVTRLNWQNKDQQHPINLEALSLEKKIQLKLPPPPTFDSVMNNGRIQSAREHNKCRIILESSASINIFYNRNLIENIQYIKNPYEVTTGGYIKMKYNQLGSLSTLLRNFLLPIDEYYYHNNIVANLASIGRIRKELRTVFDSGIDNVSYMFNNDGTYIVVNKTRNNLYCLFFFDDNEHDCCYITTVADGD